MRMRKHRAEIRARDTARRRGIVDIRTRLRKRGVLERYYHGLEFVTAEFEKVFWFFFPKKNCFLMPPAPPPQTQVSKRETSPPAPSPPPTTHRRQAPRFPPRPAPRSLASAHRRAASRSPAASRGACANPCSAVAAGARGAGRRVRPRSAMRSPAGAAGQVRGRGDTDARQTGRAKRAAMRGRTCLGRVNLKDVERQAGQGRGDVLIRRARRTGRRVAGRGWRARTGRRPGPA